MMSSIVAEVVTAGDVLLRVVWLVMGLVLGYTLGTAQTAVRYAKLMQKELHECHILLEEARTGDADED